MTSHPEPLSAPDRQHRILEQVAREGFASVRSLTEDLGVSDMTVRRDLRKLESEGRLKVVHGGASKNTFADRGQSEQPAKARIAQRCLPLVPEGAAILIDAGTTTAELARALPADFAGYVISHSIPVLTALAQSGLACHCPGGELFSESLALVGPTAVENLAKVHAEMAFMGTASISTRGIFVAKDVERSAKLAFIQAARKVVLLADHTKFDAQAPLLLAGLDVIDVLVTDQEPDKAMFAALQRHGVELLIAE